nr:CoA pyrophosphatase [Anaerolineae bacterium]
MTALRTPTLEDVRRALALPDFDHLSAWRLMAPTARPLKRPPENSGTARRAGVILLLFPVDLRLRFFLTRRTDTVASHKGQISLPGGAKDPDDATLEETALREICEELGIRPVDITVIGSLTSLYVPVSDFEIYPFVGIVDSRPAVHPQPGEVAEVLEAGLDTLLDDRCKARECWVRDGVELDVPCYRLNGHTVWGATAIILSELEHRLRAVLRPEGA